MFFPMFSSAADSSNLGSINAVFLQPWCTRLSPGETTPCWLNKMKSPVVKLKTQRRSTQSWALNSKVGKPATWNRPQTTERLLFCNFCLQFERYTGPTWKYMGHVWKEQGLRPLCESLRRDRESSLMISYSSQRELSLQPRPDTLSFPLLHLNLSKLHGQQGFTQK